MALLLTTLACCLQGQPEVAAQDGVQRPNVVLILTDDQNEDTLTHMPNVQRTLIAKGKTFQNAIFTDPLCCPSRASIHRGQYPHNTQVVQNAPPDGGWERFTERGLHRSTVGTWLDGVGYRTAYFGKVMNGYRGQPIPGYDHRYVYSADGMGWNEITTDNRSFGVNAARAEQLVAEEALGWITAASEGSAPFFGIVSFGAPHEPYPHPPSLDDDFVNVSLPDDPAINESVISDKPPYVERLDPIERNLLTESYRDALRSLVNIDRFVGNVVASVPEDTYVVFWNGQWHSPGPSSTPLWQADPLRAGHQVSDDRAGARGLCGIHQQARGQP